MLFSGSAEAVNFPKNSGIKLEITPPGHFKNQFSFWGLCLVNGI